MYQYYTLQNGIRLVHKEVKNEVAHVGLFINTGSRDELPEEHGIAHFIEHTVFKGTKKRKAFHVINRLDSVGAELNAFTTKEETVIYASFLKEYYSRTLDLISDIAFNSIFPEKELKKEKDVVIEEINSDKDDPSEMIFDQFEELIYPNDSLGRNILGKKADIKKFDKKRIEKFISNNYHTDQMVICSVGEMSFIKLVKKVEKYFSAIPEKRREKNRVPVLGYTPFEKIIQKKIYQNHLLIGNVAYSNFQKREKLVFTLLNNILGGPGLNSRLNLAIRERSGYAYQVESNYTPYCDTGIFNIYIGCNNGYLEKSIDLVYKELKILREQRLGSMQLKMAKQQFIGQMAIYFETNLNEMLSLGKSILLFNKVDSVKDLASKIESIDTKEIIDVANTVFDKDRMSLLVYKKS
ncbi:MAG: pitrilysin family protein [Bacteroidota bacterium]|nr:pitrilysin family protein [Bacteroidota bacterium]